MGCLTIHFKRINDPHDAMDMLIIDAKQIRSIVVYYSRQVIGLDCLGEGKLGFTIKKDFPHNLAKIISWYKTKNRNITFTIQDSENDFYIVESVELEN